MSDVALPARAAEPIGSSPDDEQLQPSESVGDRAWQKPRIVIVGGGFAGLAAARALRPFAELSLSIAATPTNRRET